MVNRMQPFISKYPAYISITPNLWKKSCISFSFVCCRHTPHEWMIILLFTLPSVNYEVRDDKT